MTADPLRPSHLRPVTTGALLLVGGRVVAAGCGLLQVPIALQHLGAARFGLWVALTGLLWTLAGLDGGLGFALQNRIARALALGREEEAANLARTGRRWFTRAGLGLALLALPAALAGDWVRWLGVPGEIVSKGELQLTAAVTLLAAGGALALSLAARLAAAAQSTWISGAWSGAGSLAGLAAVAVCAAADARLPGYLVASAVVPLVSHLGTHLHLRRREGWLRNGAGGPGAIAPTAVAREAAWFFVPQLGTLAIGSFAPMLVTLVAGPVAAAGFGVLQRLFGAGLQLLSLGLQPAWPAYTHAAAQGDRAGAARVFRWSLLATGTAVAATLLLLAPLARPILGLWLGASVPPIEPSLVGAVAVWHALLLTGQPLAMLLNGTDRAPVLAVATLGFLSAAAALCVPLGRGWGAAGIVAALALPYGLLNLPLAGWYASRALREMAPTQARPPTGGPAAP